MKVVINAYPYNPDDGSPIGFRLSTTAVNLLAKKGSKWVLETTDKDYYNRIDHDKEEWPDGKAYVLYTEDGRPVFYDYRNSRIDSIEFRSDPDVIAVVEELKNKAKTGVCALIIVDVDDDADVYIEFAGKNRRGPEKVVERHREWS